jgi:predicted DsbA family dithiol-disulfide isomerase
MTRSIQIDFVADVVCPWCYIGWRRLKRALDGRDDLEVKLVWRPYQLDPSLPDEGIDRKAYMRAKFGDNPKREVMMEALRAESATEGLDLRLSEIPISPNTNAAHRLIRWAEGVGAQDVVAENVMKAYFVELRDIGDPVVLGDIAHESGLDRLRILQLLSEDVDKDAITREYILAHRSGITGVPFYIFAGNTSVAGADTVETLNEALDRALLAA